MSYRMTFGWQMERFRRAQLDSVNGTTISAEPHVHDWIDGMGWHQPVKVCQGCGEVKEEVG